MEDEKNTEEEMEASSEEMTAPRGGPWMRHAMHHGWGGKGWSWHRCGCPTCQWMRAMGRMGMTGPMMPWMGTGMMRGGWMRGMTGMAPWRQFMSSEERIAGLERYLEDLRLEEKAVQERINHIRSKYQE